MMRSIRLGTVGNTLTRLYHSNLSSALHEVSSHFECWMIDLECFTTNRISVIIRPAPKGAGRTTPEQPGHDSYYHTKLAHSRRIALTEPRWHPSCSWKSREHCHPLCIIALSRLVLNGWHKLTSWIWCLCLKLFNPCFWLVFDPKWVVVNDLNSCWSSTSLCGTPHLVTRTYRMSKWSNPRRDQ